MNYQRDVARAIRGDSGGARTLYERALAIFRGLNGRRGIAGTLAGGGTLAEKRNDPIAHPLSRESIKISQELEHKRGIAPLAGVFRRLGG